MSGPGSNILSKWPQAGGILSQTSALLSSNWQSGNPGGFPGGGASYWPFPCPSRPFFVRLKEKVSHSAPGIFLHPVLGWPPAPFALSKPPAVLGQHPASEVPACPQLHEIPSAQPPCITSTAVSAHHWAGRGEGAVVCGLPARGPGHTACFRSACLRVHTSGLPD